MDKDRYSVIEFDVILIVTITQTIYIEFRLLYNRIYSTNGTFSKYPIPNQVTSEYYIQNLYPNDSGYISSDIILADIVEIEVGVDLIGDLQNNYKFSIT
jgi:hypothetical protein